MADDAVWRCYGWSTPTISFGRNEATLGRFDPESVAAAGAEAVRRMTGGRALFHTREVTYSVAFPLGEHVAWRAAYDMVNRLLVAALRSLGVEADIVPHGAGSAVAPNGPLCFHRPSPGEVVVGNAKLAGSAVWRERGAFLQHGSILLHDDQARLLHAALTLLPLPPPAAALSALLTPRAAASRVAPNDDRWLVDAVETALESTLARDRRVTPFSADASFMADITRLDVQFRSAKWLWRR